MQLLPPLTKSRLLLQAVAQWWRTWAGVGSGLSRLEDCEDQVESMARDLAMPVSELRILARAGAEGADLLRRRMAALDLDQDEVSRVEPVALQDLQRLCTKCDSRRRCARDLARDCADPKWEDYCPNAETLKALNALPWAARREW
jgi:hypothetical protein